ncbi:MAG: hypothetical protein U5K37_10610 [Natrialbaceae archaeon]|nr:hypothetical protein [Natrialbaceae archaeon]
MSDEPDLRRVVADADVLSADLLVGGEARAALDLIREHDVLELIASDPLLDDTEAIVTELATAELAADHRACLRSLATSVEQPPADHPGLASARAGGAAQLLSFDDQLRSARTGLELKPHVAVSVRTPAAFCSLLDEATIAALED